MKKETYITWLLLISFSTWAQITGVVKDSLTKQTIPYVNIAVENENKGTTSEDNGTFSIHVSEKSKNLIFSALGFERKTVQISEVSEVYLKPMTYLLDEIVIFKRYETRVKEIGKPENQMLQAFDNGPRIDTKFFPYELVYKKTKFIKQVAIVTDSKIEDATFKIHFYSVDEQGFPGQEMLTKDFIVSVSKGVKETKFNVTKFNLRMPKNGIYVGFEKLIIEKNKLEKTTTDPNTNTTKTQRIYYPFVLYNSVLRDFLFAYSGGKWIKQSKQNLDNPTEKTLIYEPAIHLILTN